MNRRAWALAAFVGAVLLVPVQARAAQGCQMPPGVPERRVSIDWTDAGVETNDTLDPSQIAAMSRAAPPPPGTIIRGLTVAETALGIKSEMAMWDDGRGGICVQPTHVTVRVGFEKPQRVYIQAGYAQGSCPRRMIQEHEQGHVRINRDTLIQHLQRIQYAAYAVLANNDVWPARSTSREAAGRMVTDSFRRVLTPEMDYYRSRRDVMHAQIDTPENYRNTARSCPVW